MKTKLNILCIIIFAAITASIINTVTIHFHDFIWGFSDGVKDAVGMYADIEKDSPDKEAFITLQPTTAGAYMDSIYNAKTETWMPMQYREIVVHEPVGFLSGWSTVVVMLCVLVITFSALFQLALFCKLIYDINRSKIFEWGNVSKLRLMGSAMIASFFANAVYSFIYYTSYLSVIEIPGYMMTQEGAWDYFQLIAGLGVLVVGEVFAIGLRLREEQELTI